MPRMHRDEVPIDADLARSLVDSQFPRWASWDVRTVESGGTDNAIFLLGERAAIRLPRTRGAAVRLEKEHRWLPIVAPHLPLTVPEPLARGAPQGEFPWEWSVYSWIEGGPAIGSALARPEVTARSLGEFVRALHTIDPTGGPAPGEHNSHRGVPLSERDAATRQAIERLGAEVDQVAVLAAWEHALAARPWSGAGVWIHGDLWETNLLVDDDGHLTAVIDFGCLGVGDPACDLSVAWNLFDRPARAAFRESVDVDGATWDRGRGWALSFALIAWPYYAETNPVIVDNARRMVQAVLDDPG